MPEQPTGHEPWTPVRITETSVTERAVFRKCRRQWLLAVVHRLRPPGGNENFVLGELVHAALAEFYEQERLGIGSRADRELEAERAYDDAARIMLRDTEAELGFLWPQVREHWLDLVELGRDMLRGYWRFDREEGGLGKVLSVEERWRVRIPGTRGWLRFRLDLFVLDKLRRRSVVDHKTAASKPSESFHDMDDQFTGYAWAVWRKTGTLVGRVVRNVLLKRAPRPPALIKKGQALSTDKRAPTTYPLFLEAIKAHGFNRADYADHLMYLAERGWTDFYQRQSTIRTSGQLDEFERNLVNEWRDMAKVAGKPELAYPNPSPMHCPSCPVRDVCQSMMDRTDTEDVIRSGYVVADERE